LWNAGAEKFVGRTLTVCARRLEQRRLGAPAPLTEVETAAGSGEVADDPDRAKPRPGSDVSRSVVPRVRRAIRATEV